MFGRDIGLKAQQPPISKWRKVYQHLKCQFYILGFKWKPVDSSDLVQIIILVRNNSSTQKGHYFKGPFPFTGMSCYGHQSCRLGSWVLIWSWDISSFLTWFLGPFVSRAFSAAFYFLRMNPVRCVFCQVIDDDILLGKDLLY